MEISFPANGEPMAKIRSEMDRIEATFNTAKGVIGGVSRSFAECSYRTFDMLETLTINPSDVLYESAFTFKVVFGGWSGELCRVRALFSHGTWSIHVTSLGPKNVRREKHLIEEEGLIGEVVRLVGEVDKDSTVLTKSAVAA